MSYNTQDSHVLTVQLSACVQGLLYDGQTNIHNVVTAGNLIAVSSIQASVNSWILLLMLASNSGCYQPPVSCVHTGSDSYTYVQV